MRMPECKSPDPPEPSSLLWLEGISFNGGSAGQIDT